MKGAVRHTRPPNDGDDDDDDGNDDVDDDDDDDDDDDGDTCNVARSSYIDAIPVSQYLK